MIDLQIDRQSFDRSTSGNDLPPSNRQLRSVPTLQK